MKGAGSLAGSHKLLSFERRRFVAAAIVVVAALVVAATAGYATHRPASTTDASVRQSVLSASAAALTRLMNFSPRTAGRDTRATLAALTDPLALDYRSRGADVVLPGAIASGATVTARVVGVALHGQADGTAKVLAFIDQQVSVPESPGADGSGSGAGESRPTSIARWAVMRNVDGKWLLADLQPVGDITR
ncbi:hypothetical protein QSJ18_14135 [Gordonia sp. ABSL1-1]|uniref:hypothetical protein n=1 Tax=Gordonia sp. ABSL1-1 TaxID=3053923 RepID=UPI002573AAB2|nr:hypothetical protein [Gordonia sp. ABSL1-1]MDL9937889.1 hypothetical protein [Gordonia sp. ABSL1-1]